MDQEIINMMTLTGIHPLNAVNARLLLDAAGSATELMSNRQNLRQLIPDINEKIVEAFRNSDEALKAAEEEFEFARKKNIQCISINDETYPQLLSQCPDAPLVLYYLGNTPLNPRHCISVVGTRHSTDYGRDICKHFLAELTKYFPDTLVVSGLAYGIDICAHRAALDCGLPTVGVLAHGLDMIYPSVHRHTAVKMIQQGGLLTEYMSKTKIDKGNFVRRNRIVAGISQATIVVESAAKGGSLITADIAVDYNREVCAFPGNIFNEYSEGCNKLIANHQAHLITSVDDFVAAVGWTKPEPESAVVIPQQQELFPQLSVEQQQIYDALDSSDSKSINQIVIDTNLPLSKVSAILLDMELDGLVTSLGGSRYKKTFIK